MNVPKYRDDDVRVEMGVLTKAARESTTSSGRFSVSDSTLGQCLPIFTKAKDENQPTEARRFWCMLHDG